jgi:hypothetical protein
MTEDMPEDRSASGRFTSDARRRELVRQLMRARRPVVTDSRPVVRAGDPEKANAVARIKPGSALPGGAA